MIVKGTVAYDGLPTMSVCLMSVRQMTVSITDVSPTMSVCLISIYC